MTTPPRHPSLAPPLPPLTRATASAVLRACRMTVLHGLLGTVLLLGVGAYIIGLSWPFLTAYAALLASRGSPTGGNHPVDALLFLLAHVVLCGGWVVALFLPPILVAVRFPTLCAGDGR